MNTDSDDRVVDEIEPRLDPNTKLGRRFGGKPALGIEIRIVCKRRKRGVRR